ncbi:MAG: cbb3-type cytochrome c oxidase N-terminal domain-containing protein [Verrucomicrobiota bacterium]
MNDRQKNDDLQEGVRLMDHEYDGIQEYDQRLPNWWLISLYGAIAFAFVYWFFFFQSDVGTTDVARLDAKMQVIEAANLEATLAMLDNDNLWKMSRNAQFVEAGRETYQTICTTCHGANLEGGIGFNLADNEWVHGGEPVAVYQTIDQGIDGTGMQAWGPSLGPKKVAEVVAFVLSHHSPESVSGGASEP